ncbi:MULTISPECIES: amidohydrolase family protein [unclassified Pseudoalteromonas]|uniref:amidohydrolase family protein n=1 Tax=unclassified Pseudoalteromonas TaxID=194690 RepID=UPI002096DE5B|nr:amidohydrolase family protein [Pseudoalteromonas sp. XMcav2-N]MCO7188983.1 amidohydrolase [Pseudoalteromonas sp. XMcav2-N]
MTLIDCDRHVMEPLHLWQEYVRPEIFKEYPVHFRNDSSLEIASQDNIENPVKTAKLPPTYYIGNHPILNNWGKEIQQETAKRPRNTEDRKLASSGLGQLQSMLVDGVDRAIIFPTFTGYIVNHQALPASVSIEYARAYNKWIINYCAVNYAKMIPVAMVSRHDPSTLERQLETIIEQGFSTITLRPEPIQGLHLGSEEYEPFWQLCERNDITIAFHGGTHLHGPTVGADRFNSRFSLHACSHALEAQLAFLSLLEGGVLEKYKKLKFAFLEAGAAWVPYWLWRLDNICYEEFPELIKEKLPNKPSHYFKQNCWVSIEPEEPCLNEVIALIGSDKLLFGSDFPHPDHEGINVDSIYRETSLTKEVVDKILESNPLNCFGAFRG